MYLRAARSCFDGGVTGEHARTEAEIVAAIAALPGVVAMTASRESGAPEVAWGDTFFFHDPDGDGDRRFPFATLVTKDYPGFDEQSQLNRPGIHRVNVHAGSERFTELLGFSPREFDRHRQEFDFAEPDRFLPHPVYGGQGWVAVVAPGPRTWDALLQLTEHARRQAGRRHERRTEVGPPTG
jgi:hypothetical protein